MIDYDKLKQEALASPKKRSRVILVPGFDMVICLHKDSYIRYHRHPKYEAYHLIEGQMGIGWEFDMGDGTCTFHSAESPIVSIQPMAWHSPSAFDCEFVIYREFYCGPFEKERDVEYASWAKAEAA